MTAIQKTTSYNYTVYSNNGYSDDGKVIQIQAGSQGFVIIEKPTSDSKSPPTFEVKKLGTVKHIQVFGRRNATFDFQDVSVSSSKLPTQQLNVNGEDFSLAGKTWFKDLDCFISLDGSTLNISQMGNGFLCFNYSVLFEFAGVVLQSPLKLISGNVSCESSTIKEVVKDGKVVFDKNCITLTKKGITLDPNEPATEHFYVSFNDGSFANVEMDTLVVKDAIISDDPSFKPTYLENYRCCSVSSISTPKDNRSVLSVPVTRYNNTSPTVKINFLRLPASNFPVSQIVFNLVHSDQNCDIDYSKYGCTKISSVDGSLVISPSSWYTEVMCTMADGSLVKSRVFRNIIPYTEVDGGIVRFSSLMPYVSNGYYMYNGTIYSKSSDFVSIADDGSLSFKQDPATPGNASAVATAAGAPKAKSFGVYSQAESTWTNYDLRQPIFYDADYQINIFTLQETSFDLAKFGVQDFKDVMKFSVDGSDKKKSLYKMTLKKGGSVKIAVVATISNSKETNVSFNFNVVFVYQEYAKTSFLIDGDANFGSPVYRRGSFSGTSTFEPYWTCGQFVGKKGQAITAYGLKIKEDSDKTGIYPIISFAESQVGVIRSTSTSLPIVANVLKEDLSIPLSPDDSYIRLTACNDVVFDSNTVKVPSNTSVCLFIGGQKIYLLRCSLIKTVSFASGNFSGASTPRGESSAPASPATSVDPAPVVASVVQAVSTNLPASPVVSVPATSVSSPVIDASVTPKASSECVKPNVVLAVASALTETSPAMKSGTSAGDVVVATSKSTIVPNTTLPVGNALAAVALPPSVKPAVSLQQTKSQPLMPCAKVLPKVAQKASVPAVFVQPAPVSQQTLASVQRAQPGNTTISPQRVPMVKASPSQIPSAMLSLTAYTDVRGVLPMDKSREVVSSQQRTGTPSASSVKKVHSASSSVVRVRDTSYNNRGIDTNNIRGRPVRPPSGKAY